MKQISKEPATVTTKALAKARAQPGRESQSLAPATEELSAILHALKSSDIIDHEPNYRKVSKRKDS